MPLIASLALFTVGVWIAVPNAGTDLGTIGWVLATVGLVCLVVNTVLLGRRPR